MAVDQAKYMNFFNNNNINQTYNESFQPLYNLNDAVYHPKLLTPAVKDDSGLTFNNSLIPPQPSRKRPRELVSSVAPQLHAMNPVSAPCLVQNATSRNTNGNISNVIDKGGNDSFSFIGQDLSLQIMHQDFEFDRLISHHMERMKVEIEERKKQQLRTIKGAMEESLWRRLKDKEGQLSKIGRINFALQEKVKSLCVENQIWRDLAQTNEATANALRTNLEQVMKDNVLRNAAAEDDVSCCGSSGYNEVDEREMMGNARDCGQNGWIYRGKSGDNGNSNANNDRLCKNCGESESSVLLLPCRHLCLCTSCGPAVNSCLICDTVKNASVCVNLS